MGTGQEEFIISDHPVHIYDPEVYPDRNGGWFSSPEVQVTFPVDRKTCLLLHPGPDRWYEIEADAAAVRDLKGKGSVKAQARRPVTSRAMIVFMISDVPP